VPLALGSSPLLGEGQGEGACGCARAVKLVLSLSVTSLRFYLGKDALQSLTVLVPLMQVQHLRVPLS